MNLNRSRSSRDVPCQRPPFTCHYHTELTRLHTVTLSVLSFLQSFSLFTSYQGRLSLYVVTNLRLPPTASMPRVIRKEDAPLVVYLKTKQNKNQLKILAIFRTDLPDIVQCSSKQYLFIHLYRSYFEKLSELTASLLPIISIIPSDFLP